MPSQPPTLPAYGPPLRVLPLASLQQHVNTTEKGKTRKQPVQLEDCKLMEMTQYTCDIKGRYSKDAEVWCKPMLRLFRRLVFLPQFRWARRLNGKVLLREG